MIDGSLPSAVELHNALSMDCTMLGFEEGSSLLTRPGILRAHGWSSSGQSSILQRLQSPFCVLRFNSPLSILASYSGKSCSSHKKDI